MNAASKGIASGSTVISFMDSGNLALIQHIDATLLAYADTPDFSADDLAELNSTTAC